MPGRIGRGVRGRAGLSLAALVGCGILVAGCEGSQPGQIGLGTLGGAAAGGALGNQLVDKPIEQQQRAQAEASRDRAMQRQLDYERQSTLQQEQVRREIEEQRLFDEWKRERTGQ